MTKKEVLNDIIYDVKMNGSADFEADDQSYAINSLSGGGYVIEGISTYSEYRNLTGLRKGISGLGKKLLWM